MLKRIGIFALLVTLSMGCFSSDRRGGGGGGGGGGGVSGAMKDYNEATSQSAQTECECAWEEMHYSNVEECVSELSEPEVLSSCEQLAAGCDSSVFLAMTRCEIQAENDFVDCMASCSDSGSEMLATECQSSRNAALSTCYSQHSSAVLAQAFSECDGGAERPTCGGSTGGTNNNSSDGGDGGDGGDGVDGGHGGDGGDGGDGGNTGGTSSDPQQAYRDLSHAILDKGETECRCYWDQGGGFTSEAACVRDQGIEAARNDPSYFTMESGGCLEKVANCMPARSAAALNCATRSMLRFNTCMASCPTGQPEFQCWDNLEDDYDDCEALYEDVEIAWEMCDDNPGGWSCN